MELDLHITKTGKDVKMDTVAISGKCKTELDRRTFPLVIKINIKTYGDGYVRNCKSELSCLPVQIPPVQMTRRVQNCNKSKKRECFCLFVGLLLFFLFGIVPYSGKHALFFHKSLCRRCLSA